MTSFGNDLKVQTGDVLYNAIFYRPTITDGATANPTTTIPEAWVAKTLNSGKSLYVDMFMPVPATAGQKQEITITFAGLNENIQNFHWYIDNYANADVTNPQVVNAHTDTATTTNVIKIFRDSHGTGGTPGNLQGTWHILLRLHPLRFTESATPP